MARPRGEDNKGSRLTDELVRRMRALRRDGWTYQELADEFGVAMSTCTMACGGFSWAHVSGEPSGEWVRPVRPRDQLAQLRAHEEQLLGHLARALNIPTAMIRTDWRDGMGHLEQTLALETIEAGRPELRDLMRSYRVLLRHDPGPLPVAADNCFRRPAGTSGGDYVLGDCRAAARTES